MFITYKEMFPHVYYIARKKKWFHNNSVAFIVRFVHFVANRQIVRIDLFLMLSCGHKKKPVRIVPYKRFKKKTIVLLPSIVNKRFFDFFFLSIHTVYQFTKVWLNLNRYVYYISIHV